MEETKPENVKCCSKCNIEKNITQFPKKEHNVKIVIMRLRELNTKMTRNIVLKEMRNDVHNITMMKSIVNF
jgi:hypothetical protein